MSFLLKHLKHGYAVDQALQFFKEKVVILRFGQESDTGCMEMLYDIEPKISKFAVVYAVNTEEVTCFNTMYELHDPFCLMFFFCNKHIQVDCGSGNNNKITFLFPEADELIAIVERVYEAGVKGRGLAVAPRTYAYKSL